MSRETENKAFLVLIGIVFLVTGIFALAAIPLCWYVVGKPPDMIIWVISVALTGITVVGIFKVVKSYRISTGGE